MMMDLMIAFKYMKGNNKEDGDSLFFVALGDRIRSNVL